MNLDTEAALIEAILYLEVDAVDLATLQRISKLSRDVVLASLERVKETYARDEHGLELVEIADCYTLGPKKHLGPALRDRYGKKNDARLSRAAMETLSIIAYSQPITRTEIENLRGVNADAMMRLLLGRDLIKEVGKKDAPGRPTQYGTTRHFLQLFGLSSIADLPKLDEADEQRFADE
ncbi:MAG: SMC-Scp complex subunit ScpB [Spirochaetaceae bacterium]|nr:MAG: SMC-Scp complex subunit ScpB [Spirochaetaceae bacterium]